jgi:hypothetical protein
MRTGCFSWLLVLVCCAVCTAPRSVAGQSSNAESYAGTWSGTWDSDSAGSGTFDLILEKGQNGAMTGKVAVTTDGGGGDYTAELRTLEFDGKKMAAKYDFPLDPSAEIVVAADFEEHAAKGTWSLRPKGQASELAGGKWTVAKK